MGINRGFRSFYSEYRRAAPLPQRSLRICFERREKPARRSAIFYLRTYVFNRSERYKIIQLYRIFIWINCNFMHSYPLEKAAPHGEIFKRFLYINILMCYALPLYARKFSRITKSVPWKTKIYLTLFVRRSACQSLIFKTALPFYGGKARTPSPINPSVASRGNAQTVMSLQQAFLRRANAKKYRRLRARVIKNIWTITESLRNYAATIARAK